MLHLNLQVRHQGPVDPPVLHADGKRSCPALHALRQPRDTCRPAVKHPCCECCANCASHAQSGTERPHRRCSCRPLCLAPDLLISLLLPLLSLHTELGPVFTSGQSECSPGPGGCRRAGGQHRCRAVSRQCKLDKPAPLPTRQHHALQLGRLTWHKAHWLLCKQWC